MNALRNRKLMTRSTKIIQDEQDEDLDLKFVIVNITLFKLKLSIGTRKDIKVSLYYLQKTDDFINGFNVFVMYLRFLLGCYLVRIFLSILML